MLPISLRQSLPVSTMIICKDIKLSSTKLRKNFQLCSEENDPMSTGGAHKTVPENWQIRQRCIVHVNKKQPVPQIWKLWIASTMAWHRKANGNVENPSVCFLLATTNSKVSAFRRKQIRGRVNPRIPSKPVAPRTLILCMQAEPCTGLELI